MENKDHAELENIRTFFYGLGSDGSLLFQGEEPIPVNRGALAFHSSFFRNQFFGPEPKTQIQIQGYDRATFKLFLDCLLGLKEYTLLDALVIYTIANEYKVTESQIKCAAALKPEVMDESVSLVLNFSAFYKNTELTNYVINFIKKNYGIVNFLENEKYSKSLDVFAMCKLIDSVDLNSSIWSLVYEWADNYLTNERKSEIKSFFVENKMLQKISFSHFESAKALVDFHKMSKNQLLCSDEILTYLHTKPLRPRKKLPDESLWVKIDPEFSFKERIPLKKFVVAYNYPVGVVMELDVVIWPNKIIFEPEATGLKIKARYLFRHMFCNGARANPQPVWNDSLHFFSREDEQKNSWTPRDYLLSALHLSEEFEANLIKDSKLPAYKFVISPVPHSLEVHWIEISYNFSSPGRILKASLDKSKYPVDNNDLYFTRNVCVLKNNEKYEDVVDDDDEDEDEDEDENENEDEDGDD